ncbi:MAG: NTP transferase domain-containing protein [Leptospiraceae bacterium]|nr:NTP transferase domain-containing protein [Leptospiraceae bacterium]
MKAMILAAGLGTRMEELTRSTPKPLLPILGIPLLAHTLFFLWKQNCSFAAINVHYLGEQIEEFIRDFPYFEIQFSREDALLGTGGGIRTALEQTALAGQFWVMNPDCIYDPDFSLGRLEPKLNSTTLAFRPRSPGSLETGFDSASSAEEQVFPVHFLEKGTLQYCGLSFQYASDFSNLLPHIPANVVDGWRTKASKDPSDLFGFLYDGFYFDAGRKQDYLNLVEREKLFPLTYKAELAEFMKRWKGI